MHALLRKYHTPVPCPSPLSPPPPIPPPLLHVPHESAMLLTANTTFMPSSTSAALVMTCGATVY